MENESQSNHRVGFHTIEMLLKLSPENIKQIFIPANRNDARIQNLISLAEAASVSVEKKKNLNQHPEATLKKEEVLDLSDLKKYEETIQRDNPTFLVIDNVIVNKHHCSPITPLVRQVSAGGTEAMKIFTVTNLINAIKHFEKLGYLILGTSEHAESMHTELDLNKPILTIIGSEEEGMREKTLEKCSTVCTLSKNETLNSLNVSVAAGVILFEITRQKL